MDLALERFVLEDPCHNDFFTSLSQRFFYKYNNILSMSATSSSPHRNLTIAEDCALYVFMRVVNMDGFGGGGKVWH